ncbi:MAG: GNAT family N-acyltransferase [Pseudomonadota bacterium]
MKPDDRFFDVRLATTEADLLGAQRLRYRVFVEELGGDGALVDHEARLERDRYDPEYRHLVLVDSRRDEGSLDHVVGVYRLLDESGAERIGRFYTEDEYDLTPLRTSGMRLLELGRSCVLADYRGGTAMYHLWQGLAAEIQRAGIEILFGVASFHGTDVTALAQPLSLLHHRHLAPPELRARAVPEHFQTMDLLPPEQVDRRSAMLAVPALIKAYLRLGGFVGEGAFVDHPFNTTDVLLVMQTNRVTERQREIYTGKTRRAG